MPEDPDCGLPLYWPAPQQVLKTSAGMHRYLWDMHYDPLPGTPGGRESAVGAVPHRTYPNLPSPWVAPGTYTVRLTVDGKSRTEPIAVKMDPRVKVTPEVQLIFTVTARIENDAKSAVAAYQEARELIAKLKASANAVLLKQVEEIAPEEAAKPAENGGGGFGPPPEPTGPATLANLGARMIASVMSMQSSEFPPTAAQLEACNRQQAAYTALMAKWAALKTKAR